ncbi:ADP-ribose pyrophosphatase YjhB, NUDIX family [Catalinimonas alkaloidigena]|uniref:ADP-ribose pyrophosphatase YjhB, NUDIX family n=1 Tax=Catalinimonas alkaloidigena TaxID=1075417 RepID=A0A1G9A4E1_9BACT|nr:NUDIX domain-containing protein [Catalinimonas alkaloidigena]SDK21714.1 ADP-ribose pyrophosphatase YjhB, NUDIX family [Catalinimonas alkaloidigena]
MNIDKYFQAESPAQYLPYLNVSGVIFGFHLNQLKVLLLRWQGTQEWCLPLGIVEVDESVDQAAQRIMQQRTGLKEIFLQQFHTFGETNRYNREATIRRLHLTEQQAHLWPPRVVSISYLALVDYTKVVVQPGPYMDLCGWWLWNQLPPMLFDHAEIIRMAHRTLCQQLHWQPIGYNLLADKFTLPELRHLYETILGRELDPRNFQRKILNLGILERLNERRKGVAHKAPYLYRFHKQRYERALREGNLSFL